ncbi:MAG: hypothetical protein ACKVS8_04380 [Phycisphaerales bacterium]
MTPLPLLAPAERLADAIQRLPSGVHLMVAGTLLAGLILWAAGRQVLKPVVVLVGCSATTIAGFMLLPVIAPQAGVSPYIGGLGGLVLGVLAGFLLYRLALAATFGLTLAAAVGLMAAALISLPGLRPVAALGRGGGLGGDEQTVPATGERSKNPYPEVVNPPVTPRRTVPAGAPGGPATSEAIPVPAPASPGPAATSTTSTWAWPELSGVLPTLEGSSDVSARVRGFVAALREQWQTAWGRFRATDQMVISLAALIGLFAGGIIGLTLPAWAAGAVTALAGAAIWLPCAAWLANAAKAPGYERLDLPPTGWAIVWGVVALLGVGIQWTGLIGGGAKGAKKARSPRGAKAAAA